VRFLDTGAHDAAWNMALDEAILKSVAESKEPVLRLYQWMPPAVTIGYFQAIELEVDTKACKERGVDVVRRLTGGGAVYHKEELTYSIIMPENTVSDNVLESYKEICSCIISALGKLGFKAEFAGINDILVSGKKISGNAQTRRKGCVLQHGTILLGIDVDEMFSLLKVPDEKMKGKIITNVKERVGSIDVPVGKLKRALLESFGGRFGSIEQGIITDEEKKNVSKLRDKYRSEEWNSKR
jgi:lipoate-protein ligase A